jgi:citrate lyase beta subunit
VNATQELVAKMNRKKHWAHPTLYTPPIRDNESDERVIEGVVNLINRKREDSGCWRMVICLEDAVKANRLTAAMANTEQILERMDPNSGVSVFVRPRDPQVLERVLEFENVNKLSGFSTPKTDLVNFPQFAELLVGTGFWLMPILETKELFDPFGRRDLRDMLADPSHFYRIDCVRIGANDLLGALGLRRPSRDHTIYDVIGGTIESIFTEFRGCGGFNVTAPVFELLDEESVDLLRREVHLSRLKGLFGQTVIHPDHLPIIRRMYKVTLEDFESAESILRNYNDVDGSAVSRMHDRMEEPNTHRNWAQKIMLRYRLFGGIWETKDPLFR